MLSRIGCSIVIIAVTWAFLLIEKCQNCYPVVDLFWHDDIFAKPRTKMTTVTHFSRQNDAGLRALTFVLWENFVLVVVLVLESKALYCLNSRLWLLVIVLRTESGHSTFLSTKLILSIRSYKTVIDMKRSVRLAIVCEDDQVDSILGDPGVASRDYRMFVVKVYYKNRKSPWALTLTEPVPEAFDFLACFWLTFLWPISEEKQPSDSDLFLHEVVFLVDRHSCVARSTGKVSEVVRRIWKCKR